MNAVQRIWSRMACLVRGCDYGKVSPYALATCRRCGHTP